MSIRTLQTCLVLALFFVALAPALCMDNTGLTALSAKQLRKSNQLPMEKSFPEDCRVTLKKQFKEAISNPATGCIRVPMVAPVAARRQKELFLTKPEMNIVLNGSGLEALQHTSTNEEIQTCHASDLAVYLAYMERRIKCGWFPPKNCSGTLKVNKVLFRAHRDGKLDLIRLAQDSGSAIADKVALEAIRNASPLTHLPSAWPETVDFEMTFDYNLFSNKALKIVDSNRQVIMLNSCSED